MAGGVCSFRTNPQRALFPTSSRKTKVRPPYILQQQKGYLSKPLNGFTSYPQFFESLVSSLPPPLSHALSTAAVTPRWHSRRHGLCSFLPDSPL